MKRKMCRFVTIFCLSVFFFSLTITAHASLVTEGRALLFNGGNPTYSKLLEANAKFAAAVKADSSDPEANLFYAVTRILAFGLEQGSGTGFETARDLLEAFGISRNDVVYVDADAPFNEPPEIYGHYDPPATIPGGEDVRTFLAGPFLTLLDAAIANLNTITDTTFNITLFASEIDDDHDVEVDYGDVLVLKSALYTLKSAVLIMTAYDLNIDLRELAVLGNAGLLQLQRDILDKYSNLLSLRADGAASLTNAKTALLNGINVYEAAFNFITTESDPQGNDLFYFGSDEDEREANFVLTQLTELKNSLNGNRPAVFTTIEDRWILIDENGKRLQIEIEKDVNGNFVSGHAWGLDGCDFLFCSGWVEEFAVSDTTVTIRMGSNHWCGTIFYTLTGTAQYDGDQVTGIEGGNYSWTDCDGVPRSGTFIGERIKSEIETETIDFNRIFGNTGKSPLDIRSIMPQFDQYDEPIAGTFGTPMLNGILPDIQTNDDLTREMELQPSGFFNIPTASITIDGNPGDWPESALLHTDPSGDNDADLTRTDLTGTDIEKVYLAKDETNLYIAMFLYDGNPNTAADIHIDYNVQISLDRKYDGDGEMLIQISTSYKSTQGEWGVDFVKRSPAWGWDWQYVNGYTGYASAGTEFIEWKVPLADIQAVVGSINGWFIATEIYTGHYEEACEWNDTGIKLNTSRISGSVTCTAHTSGNIFVWAFDGPDWRSAHRLGSAVADASGNYTITGLPVGADVYLFARWDADNNGIRTFGDYVGRTADPVTVVESGGTYVPDFSLNTLIDDSFIMTKPGVYRVFGSNTYDVPQYYYGPWNPNKIAWDHSEWTFIGESNKTQTFNASQYYKTILMVWHENSSFNFDAIEDQTAGTAFTIDESGNSIGYNWVTSGLKNSDTDQWSEPYYFKGHPDGLYANTTEWYGFNLFPMPEDSCTNTTRQLKITLVSILTGDMDGDKNVNLADAILALKVVAGLNPPDINLNADVNNDGKIGLAEVIYILQYVAGLRTDSTAPSVTPYTSDVNTVLLDHFDGATGASILAYRETGAACGSAKPSATPSYSFSSGPNGLNQAIALNPPVDEPDGSTTYLKYPDGQLLSQSNGTIEFWTYLTSYGEGLGLVQQGPFPGSCAGWTFSMGVNESGQLRSAAWAAFDMNSGITMMPLNTWTHVAATWGSTGAKLYMNGVLVGSDTNAGMPASGYGGSVMVNYSARAVSTRIDELRISNVQRTIFSVGD